MEGEKTFSEIVGEALGRASMAWSETPKGIFDSDTCSVLHIDIMNAHDARLEKLEREVALWKGIAEEKGEKLNRTYVALRKIEDLRDDSSAMGIARDALDEIHSR